MLMHPWAACISAEFIGFSFVPVSLWNDITRIEWSSFGSGIFEPDDDQDLTTSKK